MREDARALWAANDKVSPEFPEAARGVAGWRG
jgi:hypothetical protein